MNGEFETLQTLLFERSSLDSLDAIVQYDGRTVYLYLSDNDTSFGTRACWVRNLTPGPMTFVQADLERGIPPVLPSIFCNHPDGKPLPQPDTLRLVWFEEGNGVALLEQDQLLAVIPPWSGQEGFHGYAGDCIAENQVCWPLPDRPSLRQRIARAAEFWQLIRQQEYWRQQLDPLVEVYSDRFGNPRQHEPLAWRADFRIVAHRFQDAQGPLWITSGLSLFAQPNVELNLPRPGPFRRVELAIRSWDDGRLSDDATLLAALRHVAGIPWRTWQWIGDQHVCQFVLSSPEGASSPLKIELVADAQLAGPHSTVVVRDDPVNLLWLHRSAETI